MFWSRNLCQEVEPPFNTLQSRWFLLSEARYRVVHRFTDWVLDKKNMRIHREVALGLCICENVNNTILTADNTVVQPRSLDCNTL